MRTSIGDPYSKKRKKFKDSMEKSKPKNQGGPGYSAGQGTQSPAWVLYGNGIQAEVDIDFTNNRGINQNIFGVPKDFLTVSRASSGTDLLPSSLGFSYNTFAINTARITPGTGLLVEESRTNYLLNSTVPVTQTTGSLNTGTYTLWVNGSGTATSSAGTATASGYGDATQGSPNVIVITGAGTVTVTVTGTLNSFQLELNPGTVSAPTSLIVTSGTTAVRAADAVTLTSVPTFGGSNTIYGSTSFNTTVSAGTFPRLLAVSDNTSNNKLELATNSSANHRASSAAGGVGQFDVNAGGSITVGGLDKWAMSAAPSSYHTAYNGTAGTSLASGTVPGGLTTVNIGASSGGSSTNSQYIERITLWPTIALSTSGLQLITAGVGA